jgi:hypothetical protein
MIQHQDPVTGSLYLFLFSNTDYVTLNVMMVSE